MTGEPLGGHGPAIRVELPYELPAEPSVWQRWLPRFFPTEPTRLTFSVLVCCPACVAKVKADPSGYYLKVYADRHGLAGKGTQATARPPCATCPPPARD